MVVVVATVLHLVRDGQVVLVEEVVEVLLVLFQVVQEIHLQ